MNYEAPSDLLAGKVIMITGAGGGIGRQASIAYAKHGAKVILHGKTVRHLNQTYDAIKALGGASQAAIFPFDFNQDNPKIYKDISQHVQRQFGRLDGLLHNAGMLGALAPIANYSAQQWHQVIQVNLHGPFMLTQALLPLLKESDDAAILFTGCDEVTEPNAYWGAHCVSHAGVIGLMKLLAVEMQDSNVRVNAINPGAVRTTLRAKAFPAVDSETFTPPEALMPTYLYLMGADSKGVRGTMLDAQDP